MTIGPSLNFLNLSNFVDKFENAQSCVLELSKQEKSIPCTRRIIGNKFHINITSSEKLLGNKIPEHSTIRNAFLTNENSSIKVEEVFFNHTFMGTLNGIFQWKYHGQISRLWSKGFSKRKLYYYKLFIPVTQKIDHFFKLEYSSAGVYVKINNRIFLLKIHEVKEAKLSEKYALTIECSEKLDLESFAHDTYSILIAYGYTAGIYAGGRGYYFAYNKKNQEIHNDFFFSALRPELIPSYIPVYKNAFGFLSGKPKLADKYQNKLTSIGSDQFSTLVNEINSSTDFASIILSIIESSVASLLPMASGYAIILESLSNYILKNTTQKNVAPISDPLLAQKLITELKNVFLSVCDNLDEDSQRPILAKINNINQKTNMDNLKAPFRILNISILDEDVKVIKTRNDLLHGRIPALKLHKSSKSIDDNKILFYTAIKLYTIINLLVLKMIGFSGRIVNYPKIYQGYTGIKIDEEYFRQV